MSPLCKCLILSVYTWNVDFIYVVFFTFVRDDSYRVRLVLISLFVWFSSSALLSLGGGSPNPCPVSQWETLTSVEKLCV